MSYLDETMDLEDEGIIAGIEEELFGEVAWVSFIDCLS